MVEVVKEGFLNKDIRERKKSRMFPEDDFERILSQPSSLHQTVYSRRVNKILTVMWQRHSQTTISNRIQR